MTSPSVQGQAISDVRGRKHEDGPHYEIKVEINACYPAPCKWCFSELFVYARVRDIDRNLASPGALSYILSDPNALT